MSISDEELKPCPFCKHSSPYESSNGSARWYFECPECGASGPTESTYADAAKSWNTRAPAPEQERIEELEADRMSISDEELKALQGHTPGPWIYYGNGMVETADGMPIGQAFDNPDTGIDPIDAEPSMFNGQLFAAAPVLLAELIEARAEVERLKACKAQEKGSREYCECAVCQGFKTLRADRDKLAEQVKEINGCLDWGAIAAGRATTLSEVQRTIQVLSETQHALAQERIKHEADRDKLKAEVEELRKDRERMDWMETNPFMAYRDRDPEDGTLSKHFTFVNEDKKPRRGTTAPTLRAAIDAAIGRAEG